jgi:hypothetical protein
LAISKPITIEGLNWLLFYFPLAERELPLQFSKAAVVISGKFFATVRNSFRKIRSYSKNIDTVAPNKNTQIISIFENKAAKATAPSRPREKFHGTFKANRKVTVSRSPAKEQNIALVA